MKRLFSLKVATLVLAFGMFVLGARRPLTDCIGCVGWRCATCIGGWILFQRPPQPQSMDENKTQLEVAD